MGRDWFPKRTIGSLVDERATRDGAREALVFEGRRWTFAELARDVDAVARGLIDLGIGPGDKVSLWMMNRPEWIYAALAVMRIGAVLVPINTRFRTDDAAYVLNQSDSTTLIIAAQSGPIDYLAMVRELLPSLGSGSDVVHDPKLPALRRVVVLGDSPLRHDHVVVAHQGVGSRVPDRCPSREIDAVTRTGQRSSSYLGHDRFSERRDALSHYRPQRGRPRIPHGYHAGGYHPHVSAALPPVWLLRGNVDVDGDGRPAEFLTQTFDPNESLRLLEQERATILHGFDTHYKDLLEAYQRRPCDTSSVRTGILATGMSSSIPIAREGRKVFGRLLSGYGMSEIAAGAALSAPDSSEEQCTEASGYPAPGYEIRIVDQATGREQPVGSPGEILVRGYMVMQGYHRKPEETAKAIDPDGWMHTGDMGLIRPDGHLRFMGRQGHAQDRWRERRSAGGRVVPPEPSSD
jgi:fatty-acyl-CoA synthase